MVSVRAISGAKDLRLPFVCQKAQRDEFDLGVLDMDNINLQRFVLERIEETSSPTPNPSARHAGEGNKEDIKGETLAIFWFWNLGGGRVSVGSFLSQNCGEYFREMQRLIERLFKFYNATRYEAIVKTDFENGHRMIKILGFEREGTMKKFFDGKDFDLYARCK
ncbi:MAG: hypothetical protein J5601_02755 [Elusimicrobiaceae bacterium]|nr:hypothetical protein [Elusimicrobiaceae bacterium]